MVIGSKEALGRLHSSDNLINRLNSRRSAMGLFGVGSSSADKTTALVPAPAPAAIPAPIVPEPPTFVNPFEKKAAPAPAESDKDKAPSLDTLVGNAEVQIKLAQAHDLSLNTLVSAVETLATKLDDIKPEKLASVITATSKVVDQIQKQRIDATKARADQVVHLHFYTPTQRKTEEYEVIDVN